MMNHINHFENFSDPMKKDVFVAAEENSIDLSLFTNCINAIERHLQHKPSNSKFGECWKKLLDQIKGLNSIEIVKH